MADDYILIVEDENIVAKDIQLTLKRLGYSVPHTVATGEDAIRLVEQQRPQLVLMDVVLRGSMDGIQSAAVIREKFDVPVVYLTAHADEHTFERAKLSDPFGYVLKPYDERDLHTTIQMAMHKHRIERQLRDSEQWLFTTLNSIGDAVIATDTDGCVTFMNPVAEHLTGWAAGDAKGKRLEEIFHIINETTRAITENPVAKVLQHGLVVGLANHTILVARDGVERPIDDSGSPIRDEKDRVLGVVLVFRDISDRRRMEAELEKRARELAEADRRKNEFLAMLAHELRNPLSPILNATRIMRAAGTDHKAVEWAQDVVERQVRHMSRLVDDLLDVSRITRGKIQLQMEPVALATLISRAVETIQPMITARRHELTVSLPPEPVELDADATRLEQVFANLLNNAVKFTDPEGQIRLSARLEHDHVLVTIQDNGIGIAAEMLPRVFDIFAQADQSLDRNQGGLGIGLTLVRELVQLHGGSVTAGSDGIGRGSHFTVRLPVRKARVVQSAAPEAAKTKSQGLSILVVDDNVDAAQTMAMLLEFWGHRVRTAFSGPAAIEIMSTEPAQVVLLDIGLPNMDGYEVARRIRALPNAAGAVLIAMTGYGSEKDQHQSLAAGFNYHLVKPVKADAIEEVLNQVG